jgi:hypothetical protein
LSFALPLVLCWTVAGLAFLLRQYISYISYMTCIKYSQWQIPHYAVSWILVATAKTLSRKLSLFGYNLLPDAFRCKGGYDNCFKALESLKLAWPWHETRVCHEICEVIGREKRRNRMFESLFVISMKVYQHIKQFLSFCLTDVD